MKQAELEGYRFSGFHRSHIGAIKSCLDFYKMDVSPAWVYGMTGAAFVTVVDEEMKSPNIGEPEEESFKLAANLGLHIQGFHIFANRQQFDRLQCEAWDKARAALDQGWPVFAKEIDLGNETSVIYAYDEEGYYTHSWHGGIGHEGADDVIPWTKLGRNYCPCVTCRNRHQSDVRADERVYLGDPDLGGFISLHYASRTEPADELSSLKEAIQFAANFSRRAAYEWGGRTFYSGAEAYDKWMNAVRSNTILGFYLGYFADIGYEARRYAYQFLQEASQRFDGELQENLQHVAAQYKKIQDAYKALNDLFPWSQPHAPIDDPDRKFQAIELLTRIKELDQEGLKRLENHL